MVARIGDWFVSGRFRAGVDPAAEQVDLLRRERFPFDGHLRATVRAEDRFDQHALRAVADDEGRAAVAPFHRQLRGVETQVALLSQAAVTRDALGSEQWFHVFEIIDRCIRRLGGVECRGDQCQQRATDEHDVPARGSRVRSRAVTLCE